MGRGHGHGKSQTTTATDIPATARQSTARQDTTGWSTTQRDAVRRSTARRLCHLLRTRPRYRARWQRYALHHRERKLNQAAVAQVLAHHLWDSGQVAETDRLLPRRLKDTVSRALSGRVLSARTLQLFIEAFEMTAQDAAGLAAAPPPDIPADNLGGPGRIRPARPADVPRLHELVVELATYEREPDAVKATPEDLDTALFGPDPRVHALVAEADTPDGPDVVGLALWFVTFSTWQGRHGIWLEDLYVRPEHRRSGFGRALLCALAAECLRRGYRRLEWTVLDWNAPALGFYRSLGAERLTEWTTHRLSGPHLEQLARPR
ncbi:MAG: GNAT family N-acetyltransferase [Kineosporiaceae bacterium]|jgi:GNAT superfamily N-acetyltransferase